MMHIGRLSLTIVVPLLCVVVLLVAAVTRRVKGGHLRSVSGPPDGLRCRIISVDVDVDPSEGGSMDEDEQVFRCITQADQEPDGLNDMVYTVTLSADFIRQHSHITNGETYVVIPHGHAVRENATIASPSEDEIVSVAPMTRRHLLERHSGNKTVLVLRVLAPDVSTTLSRNQLASRIFGIGSNAPVVNVQTQYDACSFGKLAMRPATGNGIVGGVADISISTKVVGADPFDLENPIVAEAERRFGRLDGKFDHVLLCLPPGTVYRKTRSQWYAYGYLNWYRSVYNDKWCGYYSVAMHEIGHNLNLQHSSDGNNQYGDQSGMMGYSYGELGAPSMCFNAHKNWLLGWYKDKRISLDFDRPWGGRLVSFVNYDQASPNEYVLVRMRNIYLQYNRARSFNRQTQERPDQVLVVRGPGNEERSQLLGGVALGLTGVQSTFRVKAFFGTGHDLVIEACEQVYGDPDYVYLSIYLDNGIQSSLCHLMSPRESPPGTPRPTPAPTPLPTPSPTPSPTPLSKAPPVPSDDCNDASRSFRIDPTNAVTITCQDLATTPVLIEKLCVPSHQAFSLCEETCGVCTDACEDSKTKTFYVNKNWGDQGCAWLAGKPGWQIEICHSGHDAYTTCPEICQSCDQVSDSECEDNFEAEFFVDSTRGDRTCLWLMRNPVWKSTLCHVGHDAFHACAETCGKCHDDCFDDPTAVFYVNKVQGQKNCEWLSTRPGWFDHLCAPSHDAYEACQETCNSCHS